jgi:hypothetical protein
MSNEVEKRSKILDDLEALEICDRRTNELVERANSTFGLLSSIPMLCRELCIYREVCPLAQDGIQPVGERCPIETDLVKGMFVSYCRDLGINPDVDKVEAALIKDLCVVEVQAFRATKLMGFRDFIEQNVTAVNPNNGEVYYKDDLHISVTWTEKLINQKIKILDTLVATPYSRLKATGKMDKGNLSSTLSKYKIHSLNIVPQEDIEAQEYEIGKYTEEEEC